MATAVADGAIDQNTQLSAPIFPSSSLREPAANDASPTKTNGASDPPMVPQVNVNGEPIRSPRPSGTFDSSAEPDKATWGANFWVTLVDPQVCSILSCSGVEERLRVFKDQRHVLCMSCNGPSQLGPAGGDICVSVMSEFEIFDLLQLILTFQFTSGRTG